MAGIRPLLPWRARDGVRGRVLATRLWMLGSQICGAQPLAEAVTARRVPGEVSRVWMCPGAGGLGRILAPVCLGSLQGVVLTAQG